MKINMVWDGLNFSPMYPTDFEKVNNLKKGRVYNVEVPDRTERNTKLHNKLFAIERLLVDNLEEYEPLDNTHREKEVARERCHKELMIMIHQTDEHGKPLSISYDSMPDEYFSINVYAPIRRMAAKLLQCTEEEIENNSIFHA